MPFSIPLHKPGDAAKNAAVLERFANFLGEQFGWHYPSKRWPELLRMMGEAARDLECGDAYHCMESLLGDELDNREITALTRHLTVSETYFFREPAVFDALKQSVLPALIEKRRRSGNLSLRIWSAACCTGEETYSLAILLTQLLPDIEDWHICLLGTDVSPRALRRAEAAVYAPWSFRNEPDWLRRQYFTHTQYGSELLPRIRQLVTFQPLNLMDDVYPSVVNGTNAMDLVLCRNVLIYFDRARIQQVVSKLHRSLVDGGWLVVGAAEADHALFGEFRGTVFPEALFYQKASAESPVAKAMFQPPVADGLTTPSNTPPFSVIGSHQPVEVSRRHGRSSALRRTPSAPAQAKPSAYAVARDAYMRGDYAVAMACLSTQPGAAPCLLLRARILANQGQLEEAARLCEAAAQIDKLNPSAHYLLAVIRGELADEEAAALALKRTLYLDPEFVLAYVAMGNLARRQHKHDAQRYFEIALDLLSHYAPTDALTEADGLTAGRLAEIIKTSTEAV